METTIAILCGFKLLLPMQLNQTTQVELTHVYHNTCIYKYQQCMNKKMKGAKPSTWGEAQKKDFLWECMGEITEDFKVVSK